MKPTPKKKGISAQTFNMLVFASVLVIAICLIVLLHYLTSNREKEKDEEATGMETAPDAFTAYYLHNLHAGPLALCSPSHPWTQAQVDAVFPTLIPLKSLSPSQEEPYRLASNSLFAKGDAVMALRTLCLASPSTYTITQAYLSYEEAKEMAGTSPFHTGYTFSLSPLSDAESLWLQNNAHTYGFVFGEGILQYVTPPHAKAIWEQKQEVEPYIETLKHYTPDAPLAIQENAYTYLSFYIPAHHGTATLTLKSEEAFLASGNARDGFVVTLLVFSSPL